MGLDYSKNDIALAHLILLSPWGGLEELAGSAAPHRKVPVLSVLLKNRGEEEQFLEHLAFGIALALLYER